MNRSESKYFNTAVKMDLALLALLEKKDFAYITVKEICEAAGVNRSTFYLHYETVGDLLEECVAYLNRHFHTHMPPLPPDFFDRLADCPPEELYLVTPAYLMPYLTYIREHRRIFRTAVEQSETLRLQETYNGMFYRLFSPILARCQVPPEDQRYLMAFYMKGLMAILTEWLKTDCAESMEQIAALIQRCVQPKGFSSPPTTDR